MLTTQIGSLPFQDIETAIDYAINFDLPFIPTLPKFKSSEMMDVLAMSGLNQGDHRPIEVCLSAMLEKHSPKVCKYQILGPVSALFIDKRKSDVEKLHTHLLLKISEVIKLFKAHNTQPVIFLDEPCLEFAHENDYQYLKEFLHQLSDILDKDYLGLHCCSDANWSYLAKLPIHYLSFDYTRYFQSIDQHIDALKDKNLCFGIYPTYESSLVDGVNFSLLKKVLTYSTKYSLEKNNQLYLTPSCGLGLSSIALANEVLKIKDLLSEI
jgi:methionine synthase II (cobalamin-independent)